MHSIKLRISVLCNDEGAVPENRINHVDKSLSNISRCLVGLNSEAVGMKLAVGLNLHQYCRCIASFDGVIVL